MGDNVIAVNPWMILPFGLLLSLIALAPLLFAAWWLKHYAKVACALAAITLAYYFFGLRASGHVWHTAHEYVSFISLIGSLYVVSGGIHIGVKGKSGPLANVAFLLVGAILANVLGTTGASMLLIRPWIRMNRHRIAPHHVVFFIFIVSNVGGCLTPIGDPPLFLGYLLGVPFWWVARNCLLIWAVGVGILLLMFLALDFRNAARAPKKLPAEPSQPAEGWRFDGLPNLFFQAVILGAVFIERPLFLREGLMLGAALGSWFTTRKSVHKANQFNFHPIQEVAILFIGIFATMMPALDWLQANAGQLEHATPAFFYWGCGTLSGALDNAPTYLCFIKSIFGHFIPVGSDIVAGVQQAVAGHGANLAALSGHHAEEIRQTMLALQQYHGAAFAAGKLSTEQIEVAYLLGQPKLNLYLVAVSIGAVFFGANSYIGNGPNFMVKSIADQQGIPTPGFLGYIFKYTLPFMLPMLIVIWWLFFRS
jgi:Na+/H+ antiporter NhaD/arsenite permease-like protein